MLYEDYTTDIIGLKDVIVTKVWENDYERHINIELERKEHLCPHCHTSTNKIHDYREQKVKDIDSFGKHTFLHIRKRRYRCPECGKRFYEDISFIPRYYRRTVRLTAKIINDFREVSSASIIAKRHNISVTTAIRCFDLVKYRFKCLPEVLSMDEFKGNAGGERYQTIITDPKNHKVLDILPNRKSTDLEAYFRTFSTRNSVKYVVIDMSRPFFEAARSSFPKATIVVDKYHVIRQAVWAFEKVRIEEQKKFAPSRRKYFKRSKALLNKHPSKLNEEDKDAVGIMLETSERLRTAYHLKNKFQEMMWSKNSLEGKEQMKKWILMAELADMKEFKPCLTAVHNWSPYILNAFDCGYTNGYTEGCNNKTKVLKRTCYGVRNFNRFRNRILHCSA